MRSGIGGTKIHVHAEPSTVVRTAAHISGMVEEARLPDRVRRRALATFDALALAEGHLHRRPPESVHFHEVGGIDAIIDVVGTCAALEVLGIDEVDASPVAQGIGMVRSAHGLLPIPAPAVVELLRGAPTYQLDVAMELTTPTGAALLAALVTEWGPMPALTIDRTGFGAGTADLGERPNLVQVVIGDRSAELTDGQPVVLLEANVDDATGETLAHAIAELLERRRPRRLAHADPHEEGSPGLHGERAGRPGAGRPGRPACWPARPGRSACGARRWSGGRRPGRVATSRSRAGRSGSRSAPAGSRSSTTTRPASPARSACRSARSCRWPRRRGGRARPSSPTASLRCSARSRAPPASGDDATEQATVAPIGHLHDGHDHDHDHPHPDD